MIEQSLVIPKSYRRLALLLHAAEGVGRQTVLAIINYLKKSRITEDSFRSDHLAGAVNIGLNNKKLESIYSVTKEQTIYSYINWLIQQQIRVLWYGDKDYSDKLLRLSDPPLFLYQLGNFSALRSPALAVVGARRCTPYGIRATRSLVSECCEAGVQSVVSGLMYGIDSHAHQVALEKGVSTAAVLGYGFGRWFPLRMGELGKDILARGGALLSEYPPGFPPNKGTFLERNRLVAALADAVLVPEASARSGTQRTVAVAAELGIPVGAVPGPFDSEYSRGTQAFINQGAILVSSAQDILGELGLRTMLESQQVTQSIGHLEALLQAGPLSTDELSLTLQQSVVQLSFELSSLELAGRIVRRSGKWYRL